MIYSLPVNNNTADLEVVHTSPLPQFASFKFPTYEFKPNMTTHIGIGMITGILKNYDGEIKFQFSIIVENEAPSLNYAP